MQPKKFMLLLLTCREELITPLVPNFQKDKKVFAMHSQKNFEDFSLFIFGQTFNHMSIEPCWTVLCLALILGMLTSSFSIQIREAYIPESLCRKKLQSLPVCRRRPKSQRKNRKCHHVFDRRESNQEKITQFLIPFQFLWTLFFPQKASS